MNEVELQAGIDRAAELIVGSEYTTALVGAGMSVESGIPPFRGPGGIWTKYGEPAMDGYQKMMQNPEGYWLERNSEEGPMAEFRSTFEQARPNPGHLAMAEMEEMGYLRCIITQNVDNLHQVAGSMNVAEIHGNSTKLRCVGCNSRWDAEEYEVTDYPPLCDDCGGIIKADTVMFGEPIPFDVLVKCDQESKKSDCMMLVGTTGGGVPGSQLSSHDQTVGWGANRGKSLRYGDFRSMRRCAAGPVGGGAPEVGGEGEGVEAGWVRVKAFQPRGRGGCRFRRRL